MSGFLCGCTAELAINSIVEVFMTNSCQNYVGKAMIIHSDSSGPLRRYGCSFIEKAKTWVLQ